MVWLFNLVVVYVKMVLYKIVLFIVKIINVVNVHINFIQMVNNVFHMMIYLIVCYIVMIKRIFVNNVI